MPPDPAVHREVSQAPEVVAAVDCGTNSTRLLVAGLDDGGNLVTLDRRMRITRLGQGVDATGRLAPEAIARTTAVLAEYRGVIRELGATAVRATATSAARDAANRDDFFGPAADALGSELDLLSGDEEGRLSFLGATSDLPHDDGSYLIADIGGGSTELVVGTFGPAGAARIEGVHSLDVGCVRVTERHLRHDPPTPGEIAAASAELRSQIGAVLASLPGARQARRLLGLAGTVSTVAAIDQGLIRYDRDRIHHYELTAEAVERITTRLLALPSAARVDVPGMEPGRAEVIAGGCLVLRALLRATGFDSLLVSESDILDGLARSLLDGS